MLALGCKVNAYERDAIKEALIERGDVEVFKPEEASLIIVNTCSVTATSDQKSRQQIRKMNRLSPNAVIAVMGCYSEGHLEEAEELEADVIIGTSNRDKLLQYIDKVMLDGNKIVDVSYLSRTKRYEELGAPAFTNNTRAQLKVQDGCDKFCSYCLIPFVRGNSRSRKKEDALKEVKSLIERGYSEIVLTGIEVGFYGFDLYGKNYGLGELIEDIIVENPRLRRLRLSSLDVSEITPKILDDFRKYDKLMPHIHLSLQSGSESVLKRMKRNYTKDQYLEKITTLRNIRPDIAITTDIIAGFPGETDEEWKETGDFAKKCEFAEIHVFPYSARKGTAAANMKGQVDPMVKEQRVKELLAVSRSLRNEYEKKFYGKEVEVLFEDYDKTEGYSYGHTGNYLLVKQKSPASMHDIFAKVVYDEDSKAD